MQDGKQNNARIKRRQTALLSLMGTGVVATGLTVAIVHSSSQSQRSGARETIGPSTEPVEEFTSQIEMAPTEVSEPTPEIAATAQALGYASISKQSEFADCRDMNALNARVSAFAVCNAQPMPSCPYAIAQPCTVEADFVNGMPRLFRFSYDAEDIKQGALKATLDKEFGFSEVEVRHTDVPVMTTWTSRWQANRTSITLVRTVGENYEGFLYGNVSLTLTDPSLPDPFKET